MAAPARITIELEAPRNARERWRARTRVEGDLPRGMDLPALSMAGPKRLSAVPDDLEAREPSVVPAAYEPPSECTCVEGWCDADHEHE